MKIAVTADLHFSMGLKLSSVNRDGITTRLQDQLDCLLWMRDIALDRGCDRMVIAGDIFDSRSAVDIPVLDRVYDAVHNVGKDLIVDILPGNHDSYARTPKYTSVLPLDGGNVHVHTQPTAIDVGRNRLVFVPWYDSIETLSSRVLSIQSAYVKGSILFSHALLIGAANSNSGVPIKALHEDLFDAVWLGDVHDPTVMSCKVRYAGAPMQLDYRDAGSVRGFFIVDTEDSRKLEYIENGLSPKFHVVTTDYSVKGLKKADFIRVAVGSKVPLCKVDTLRDSCANVECVTLPDEITEDVSRMDIDVCDTVKDVMGSYLRTVGCDDLDKRKLLTLGLRLMEIS